MILTMVVGLPFFVMSSITPTLQKWFEGIGHESSADPYFLYAASNVGSMLGLLSYPILIEPHFSLVEQSRLWEYGYGLLILLVVICAITLWRAPQRQNPAEPAPNQGDSRTAAPEFRERLLWMGLAFVPSSLMLGVTTVLTTEIPPIPMLWVLPLAVYLLSFILVFAKKPVISSSEMAKSMPLVILLGMIPLLLKESWPLYLDIAVNLITLLVVAVACHGELAKRRPPAEHLTGFYLWMALGGVLGGLFNAVIAPVIFSTVVEFPLALLCAALLRQVMAPASERQRLSWQDVAFPFAIGVLVIILLLVPRKFGFEPGVILNLIILGPAAVLCLSFGKRPIRFALGFAALLIAGGATPALTNMFSARSAASTELIASQSMIRAITAYSSAAKQFTEYKVWHPGKIASLSPISRDRARLARSSRLSPALKSSRKLELPGLGPGQSLATMRPARNSLSTRSIRWSSESLATHDISHFSGIAHRRLASCSATRGFL